jgi:hypothetical protein
MKNQLFFTLLASLILLPFVFLGQTHVLHLPQKYLFPTSTVEAPKPEDAISNRPWFVWSDRANNPVYRTSNCSELIAELEFGVECAVLEINNERLLIAHAKEIRQGNFLDPEANAIGWIDFNNLLLWSECLKAGPCKLDKKALVFNADDRDGLTQTDIPPKFLNGPDHIYEVITDAGRDLVRKYFVFKETSDYLLLGNTPFLEKINNFDDAIVGWMPKKYCLIWNSNVALEINWEPEAVAERERMNNNVLIWENETDAAAFNKNAKHLYVESPLYQERSIGFNNRFFILEQQEDQSDSNNNRLIKVGFLREETKDTGQEYFDIKTILEFNERIRNIRNINLIFVIDASRGMETYSSSISSAIQSTMRMIEDEKRNRGWAYEGNQIKFGVLLFRDEAEEQIVQNFGYGLTDDIKNLPQWIESNMNPQFSMFDRDTPEALFYGINEAIDIYYPDLLETNYMIVIGAAGDHQNPDKIRTFKSENEVINRLVEHNMNLVAFQVHRPPMQNIENPFQDFEDQLKHIMISSAEKLAFETSGGVYFEESEENTFKLNDNSPVFGEILISPSGSRMTSEQLESRLVNTIIEIDKRTTDRYQTIIDIMEENNKTYKSPSGGDLKNLGLTDDEIEIFLMGGLKQSYHEGYTFLQPENAEHPWFKYVLLIERRGMEQLISALIDLAVSKDYPIDEQRMRLINTAEQMLHVYFGNLSREIVHQITFGDLFFCITSKHSQIKISNLKIHDLADLRITSDANIRELVDYFHKTLISLQEIYYSRDNYASIWYPGSDEIYYWVPLDIFSHD